MTTVLEYRVRWRKRHWAKTTETKTRRFERLADAKAFCRKLAGDDVDALAFVELQHRAVTRSEWRPVA